MTLNPSPSVLHMHRSIHACAAAVSAARSLDLGGWDCWTDETGSCDFSMTDGRQTRSRARFRLSSACAFHMVPRRSLGTNLPMPD